MTKRSIFLGLTGVAFICGFTFFNDRILRQSSFIGNNIPVSVYGLLIIFVLFINPRLKRWSLTGREIVVILVLTLAAAAIPGSGLLRTFTSSLILPHHYNRIRPAWQEHQVIEMVPEKMLADVSQDKDVVLDGFVMGLRRGGERISFGDVPWFAWTRMFMFWLPLILTLWMALIALSLVLHRQWSRNEHLPYPLVKFADMLLPEPGKVSCSLFRNRLFWIGATVILLFHLNNYMHQWFPEHLIAIPRSLPFAPLGQLFPLLIRGGGGRLLHPNIYFTVVGIAFLIPASISLSFGVGPFLWTLVVGVFALYGINMFEALEGASWYTGLHIRTFLLFGANLGIFLTLLYTGRHYYRKVLNQSLGFSGGKEADPSTVWGCRIFLGLMGLFILQLTLAGLDWQLSLLYAAILIIFYVVMSRLIAETGLFYIQPFFFPCVILWGLFGARAIGPSTLLIMQVLTLVFVIDPRESLMPFMVNSLKLSELRRVKLGRVSKFSGLAIILGLAIALPLTLWIQYDHGSAIWCAWAESQVPTMQFDNAVEISHRLSAQGLLETSEQLSGWERFGTLFPHPVAMVSLVAGLGLVLLFAAGRLRFPWWPLHPLLFVTWSTEPIMRMSGAFLLGWFIKIMVTKYGGSNLYNKLKPLMIGLIAGEMLGAVIPIIVGTIYYFVTGNPPIAFHVLPT